MLVEITQISKTPRSAALFARTRAGERTPRSACFSCYRPFSHCIHYDGTPPDSVPLWHQMYAKAGRSAILAAVSDIARKMSGSSIRPASRDQRAAPIRRRNEHSVSCEIANANANPCAGSRRRHVAATQAIIIFLRGRTRLITSRLPKKSSALFVNVFWIHGT
jgi:hypothetical protein